MDAHGGYISYGIHLMIPLNSKTLQLFLVASYLYTMLCVGY